MMILLLLASLSLINTESICSKNCQNNNLCVQKCVEYEKNPNRNRLSAPYCGLSRLGVNLTDYEYLRPRQAVETPSWPWIVSLQYQNMTIEPKQAVAEIRRKYDSPKTIPQRSHFCTGVILSENFILSSAHCVPKEPGGYQVMIGTNSLYETDKNAQIVEIDSAFVPGLLYKPWIKRHEDFEKEYFDNNDLLLIKTATKMETKLKDNNFVINSICLPEPQMFLDYKSAKPLGMAQINGWGYDDIKSGRAAILKEVQVPLISNEMANKVLKETHHYFGNEGQYFVYNYTLSKKDLGTMVNVPAGTGQIPIWAFNGDSGSSVVKIINGRAFTLGVSHWISKGQNPISVWARTSYYLKWLEENMKKTIWQI